MEAVNIRELCQGYLAGSLTPKELEQFLAYLGDNDDHRILREEMLTALQNGEYAGTAGQERVDLLLQQILAHIHPDSHELAAEAAIRSRRIHFLPRRWWAVAAVLLLLIGTGVYYRIRHFTKEKIAAASVTPLNDITPGGNKATLTLSNGAKILLDSAHNGELTSQGNSKVVKVTNGLLAYSRAAAVQHSASAVQYNTLSTPKGGQYRLRLPDGTAVWLNAASSIRYPTAFTGKERKVEITGEAYFEVAANATMPFVVKQENTEVEVLGTHFNVNAYTDESVIKVTLLEGAVRVRQSPGSAAGTAQQPAKESLRTQLMGPGEQAVINKENGGIKLVKGADVEEAVAWKNGLFQFDGNDIHEVMRQVARWYNVDVEYSGTVSQQFYGNISRNVNVSEVFKMLEMTEGARFIITPDKKIMVMPYK